VEAVVSSSGGGYGGGCVSVETEEAIEVEIWKRRLMLIERA
jgi:hypothetical protein